MNKKFFWPFLGVGILTIGAISAEIGIQISKKVSSSPKKHLEDVTLPNFEKKVDVLADKNNNLTGFNLFFKNFDKNYNLSTTNSDQQWNIQTSDGFSLKIQNQFKEKDGSWSDFTDEGLIFGVYKDSTQTLLQLSHGFIDVNKTNSDSLSVIFNWDKNQPNTLIKGQQRRWKIEVSLPYTDNTVERTQKRTIVFLEDGTIESMK